MSNSRTQILNQIARSLDTVSSNLSGEFEGDVPRKYRRATDVATGSAQALEILTDRLEDYRAVVHRAEFDSQVPSVIAQALGNATSLVYPNGLHPYWLTALPNSMSIHEDSLAQPIAVSDLDRINAVLTACRVAVADTGTIILDGTSDQGRRAITLVPDTHVCVVRADQIVHILPQAIDVLTQFPLRPQTWISGPSATSDIELNRVEGVHGPRNLHVIIVG